MCTRTAPPAALAGVCLSREVTEKSREKCGSGGEGRLCGASRRCRRRPPLPLPLLSLPSSAAAAAMAAPLASPGHRSRFEQEQERAVRALVRSVTGLPEEELGGGRFQTALNFAWSNFRSAPAPGEKLGGCDGALQQRGWGRASERRSGPLRPAPAGAHWRR